MVKKEHSEVEILAGTINFILKGLGWVILIFIIIFFLIFMLFASV